MVDKTSRRGRGSAFLYGLVALMAIGGFLFGYDTGVVSGAMLLLKDEFKLNYFWQQLFVSITIAAAAIGALAGGAFADVTGRKVSIFLGSFVFALGAILLGAAQDRGMLLGGRFIVGLGIGLASAVVPMYIAEVSPPELRGVLIVVNNLLITGGQFAASLINGAFSYTDNGWRYMLGIGAIPAVVQFVGFLFMPESPRWLISKGRYGDATNALLRIRGGSNKEHVEIELEQIRQHGEESRREVAEKGGKFPLLTMLRFRHLRLALLVGCALQIFQQTCGINTVMYYSATIIEMSGVKGKQLDIWLAAGVAGVNFFCTFIGVALVERIGRRKLLLFSLAGVTASLLLLAVGFQVISAKSPPVSRTFIAGEGSPDSICYSIETCDECISKHSACGYCFFDNLKADSYNSTCLPVRGVDDLGSSLVGECNRTLDGNEHLTWASSWCPTAFSWVPILGLVLYLFFFAPGMGCMPWTLNSEIYPQWARSTGIACATACNWIFNLIVSMTFLSLTEAITKYGTYYLYTGVSVFAFLFFFLLLPETKGRSLEDVESLFEKPWFTRNRRKL